MSAISICTSFDHKKKEEGRLNTLSPKKQLEPKAIFQVCCECAHKVNQIYHSEFRKSMSVSLFLWQNFSYIYLFRIYVKLTSDADCTDIDLYFYFTNYSQPTDHSHSVKSVRFGQGHIYVNDEYLLISDAKIYSFRLSIGKKVHHRITFMFNLYFVSSIVVTAALREP